MKPHRFQNAAHKQNLFKRGDVIGLLTVGFPAGRDPNGSGVVWACKCQCGVVQYRLASHLNRCLRSKTAPACPQCRAQRKELDQETLASIKAAQRRQGLLRRWEITKSLYGTHDEYETRRCLMEDLIQEFGPLRDPTLKELGYPAVLDPEPLPSTASESFYGEYEDSCPRCQGFGCVKTHPCPKCKGCGRLLEPFDGPKRLKPFATRA